MALTRRQFLTLTGGATAAPIIFLACGVPEQELLVESPLEMPEDLVSGLDNWYATLCRQCGTSEGVVIRVMEGRAKKVEGNVDYPINMGKHSARCEGGLQALYHPDRIKGPLLRSGERGRGQYQEISWADALGRLNEQLSQLQSDNNENSMVMVTNPISGHLGMIAETFTNKFGGRHMPYEPVERTNLKAAIKQVFGQDRLPDFDLENANYVLSFGADFLNTWVSPTRYARGYGEFRQGDRSRGTLTHVDSRFSMTGANADSWLHVKPGMEGILALSIAHVIIKDGLAEPGAAAALTGGSDLAEFAPAAVAEKTGISAEKIEQVAHDFAGHKPAIALGGGSAGAHTNGLFNLSAIYSLNYLVGSVGQPGGVVFNPAPPLSEIANAPASSSYQDWAGLVSDMRAGNIELMMVRGADPMHGLPGTLGFRDASFDVPVIVSFSNIMDDTTAMADIILPEHNSLEDWGTDTPDAGPGYELVGFQQPVVRPFFESRGENLGTRGFADVLLAAAQGLSLDLGLSGDTYKEILQDSAEKLFNLNRGSVRSADFRSFWNGVLQRGGWWDVSAKASGAAPTPPRLPEAEEPRFDPETPGRFEFHLLPFSSTGIGEGQGAHLPWLQATPDPITTATWLTWVEINIQVAEDMDLHEGDVVRVTSPRGSVDVLAYPHPGVPPDVVAIPMGQGHRAGGRYAEGRGANVFSILSDLTDQKTGALAWSATRVGIEKLDEWIRLPKFENTVTEPPEDEEGLVIEVTTEDS
ncbi:MAG: molybdopterin-dependent oxidoreductase [SAR202 cluster bacterium]|jgi:anaerobic selenocysteine-containing dehydrogenase|nr:molybdopterin-dependent oxidoreductase [SAR202 cluster bacterium]MDP6715138.1 molybdopterin-dependent oxidoreductase [SAR202 cluster bacterium]